MKNIIRMSLVAAALVSSVAAQAQTAWADKISLGGDLRFRLNNIEDKALAGGAKYDTVTTNQIRGRITASAKVNDAMTANFRISSDDSTLNRRSSNYTLDNAAQKSPIAFDLAYGDWRVMPGLVISLGKAPNPFWQGGKNEMIWDADLAFDGLTAKWTVDMDTLKPFVNFSYNTIDQLEQTGGIQTENAMQVGAQVGTTLAIGDQMNATVAVGYHNFTNSTAITSVTPGQYQLLDVTAELGLNMVANLPLAVYVDWVNNGDAVNGNEDTGFLAGLRAGQFANVGSWEAWYNYRDVQAQAVVNGLGDSEFAGGQNTDVRGHQIGGGYMAWDNTTVGLNYWMNTLAGGDYNRLTADLIWKF